jgi:putative ABC transport system substrate-binding protein
MGEIPQRSEPLIDLRESVILSRTPRLGQQMQFGQLRRREFITVLGGVSALPITVRAQQGAMPVIGVLGVELDGRTHFFHQGLAEAGYVEGRNITIEYRWSKGHVERYPELVAELVRRPVTVIATLAGIPPALAAKAATATIPIVFAMGADPVEIGLVATLSRPGGNITGSTSLSFELGPKRLEVMHELFPAAKRFALLINSDHSNAEPQVREMDRAARALGVQISIVRARAGDEFDAALASIAQLRVGGIVVANGQPLSTQNRQLGELVSHHRLPAISGSREFVVSGGLASYGASNEDAIRLAGHYVGRILAGERPADLPVQQATKVELVISMKTAEVLGITVPLSLLGRADEVIE